MKLISCYIENFGGLHQYHLDFRPGLTVIEEPNGFGKTTLAEFIRAMFYGFPRASKNLEKNLRKKYEPWQGGKFGGNLIFEHSGIRYRIDRSFGSSPSKDTFLLTNDELHRKSLDFSENIGLELFQLDSESFERSTYLPQLRSSGPLTTASIQSKLSDLVDDTNDINNFDKAVAALRAKRSGYIPYRGSGGTVNEAQSHISRLQTELACANSLHGELDQRRARMEALRQELTQKKQAYRSLTRDLTRAAHAEAARTIHTQYDSMRSDRQSLERSLHSLQERYPAGLPTREDLEEALSLYDAFPTLSQAQKTPQGVSEARQLIRSEAAALGAGVPDEAVLDDMQQLCDQEKSIRISLAHTQLTPAESQQLEELTQLFPEGVPEAHWINDRRQQISLLQSLRSQQQTLPSEQSGRLQQLESFFCAGRPTEAELKTQQETLQKLCRLQDENARLTAQAVPPDQSSVPGKRMMWGPVLGILGAAVVILGVIMMATASYALGGASLGVGVLLLIGSIWIYLEHRLRNSGHPAISSGQQLVLQKNQETIRSLEQSLQIFLSRYPVTGLTMTEKLGQVRDQLAALAALQRQEQERRSREAALTSQITSLQQELESYLLPSGRADESYEARLSFLELSRDHFLTLQQTQDDLERERQRQQQELAKIRQQLTAFLEPLCGLVEPDRFSAALLSLRQRCDRYRQAQQQLAEWKTGYERNAAALQEHTDRLKQIFAPYHLSPSPEDRSALRMIRDDVTEFVRLTKHLEDLSAALAEFEAQHTSVLKEPADLQSRDLQSLKDAAERLQEEQSTLNSTLLEEEQQIRILQQEADLLPGKEDELAHWTLVRQEDSRSSHLLDQTVHFLEEARETLSKGYLGTVQNAFARYARSLAGLEKQQLLVSSELEIEMECLGQPRELGYFSAGQSDILTLCMHLALADALFKDAAPLLILDDPFVNLDDRHTSQALALLQELSKTHQILYLVCHSSRTPA